MRSDMRALYPVRGEIPVLLAEEIISVGGSPKSFSDGCGASY
jgi:uncharacterized protein YbaR (Trm112 family)